MGTRMASGTKKAAKEAKALARTYVPGVSGLKTGGKLARDVAGHLTIGPYKELLQGQARANMAPVPKEKKVNRQPSGTRETSRGDGGGEHEGDGSEGRVR